MPDDATQDAPSSPTSPPSASARRHIEEGGGHRNLRPRREPGVQGAQRRARHRDRVRAALPPSLLHGLRHSLESVKAEFPSTRTRSRRTPTRSRSASCSWAASPDLDPQARDAQPRRIQRKAPTCDDMLREDLVAERIAIDSYREIVEWLAAAIRPRAGIMEEILAKEGARRGPCRRCSPTSLLSRALAKRARDAGPFRLMPSWRASAAQPGAGGSASVARSRRS